MKSAKCPRHAAGLRKHAALYWRVAIISSLVVLIATLLSFVASKVITRLMAPALSDTPDLLFGIAIKEMLAPLFTVLLAVAIFSVTSHSLTSPVRRISAATREIASGNFSARIEETGRKDELGELQRNFNLMAAELESNEVLKRDFTANISHQFKTPLAIIQGYSRLLEEDGISDEDRRRYAALITRESERLAKLSSDMLRLARIESQEILVAPKRFLLNEQILQTIVRLEPKWTRKEIDFDIDLPELYFVGDEELLSQVWLNLIDNAVKFSPQGGVITVDMQTEDGAVTVAVTDRGCGMDAVTTDHVFQRYYQGKGLRSKEGSGLGLAIVKSIVELHDGTVAVRSAPREGATFTVRLPMAES